MDHRGLGTIPITNTSPATRHSFVRAPCFYPSVGDFPKNSHILAVSTITTPDSLQLLLRLIFLLFFYYFYFLFIHFGGDVNDQRGGYSSVVLKYS